jgi:RimJ/RimL family protein N-acetyltransferase
MRELRAEDTETLYALFSDEKMEFIDIPLSSSTAFGKWLNELMAVEMIGFAIARVIQDSKKQVAGMVLLTNIDQDSQSAEMGTWLGKTFRGKGLNASAKNEMLRQAFERLGLSTVILVTAKNNIASQKALAKLPYVSVPPMEKYASLRKHREFLCGKQLQIYEVKKEVFHSLYKPA